MPDQQTDSLNLLFCGATQAKTCAFVFSKFLVYSWNIIFVHMKDIIYIIVHVFEGLFFIKYPNKAYRN